MQHEFGQTQIGRKRDFEIGSIGLDQTRLPSCRFKRARFVGDGGISGKGFPQQSVAEHLRRLRLPQAFARLRIHDTLVSIGALQGIGHRHGKQATNRIVAQRQVDDAFEALITLTNRQYNSIQGIVHTLPVLPPAPNDAKAWVETAGRQNLNLLASNYAVTAAEETLRQRKAGHLPTLDAVAQYEKGDNDALGFSNPNQLPIPYGGDVSQRTVGLRLNIPIYSGGLTSSQVRESYSRLDQTEQQREGLRRQVVENTRNLHRAVNTDVEQVQARRQSIISNQSAVEATEIGYQVGTRNIVDVLDSQRQLYASVRNYNNSRYDYILDNLRLKQAAGTLNPGDLQDLARYLKADYNPDKDFLPPDLAKAAAEQLKARPGY